MGRNTKRIPGDDTPVVGGRPTPPGILRDDLPDLPEGTTPLTRQLMQMMALHPKLQIGFRADSLATMSESDQLNLYRDMCDALGIQPLTSK